MRLIRTRILIAASVAMGAVVPLAATNARSTAALSVFEVVALKLKPGATAAQFRPIDKTVQTQHVARQPGFLSRESAPGAEGRWVVIVHWRSIADADASMKSFASAPAAAGFMASIVPDSVVMTRYGGQ